MDVNGITGKLTAGITGVGKVNNNPDKLSANGEKKPERGMSSIRREKVSGKTVGDPMLSTKAKEYYEELKSKYGDMEFVLVSSDQKENAKQMAGSFANPNKMVVLIDEEKIEKMAEDEDFRKQYEGLIEAAATNIPKLKDAFDGNQDVAGYGMQVNDNGTASFFAIMKKNSDEQAERIQEKRAERAEERKAERKKEEKKEAKEKLEELREKNRQGREERGPDIDVRLKKYEAGRMDMHEGFDLKIDSFNGADDDIVDMFGRYSASDYEIISASSVDELINMVRTYRTGGELSAGASITQSAVIGGNVDYTA
ncbi:MAG: DUF6033 family protein [Lachnospiraceae bacterium]|nr:DUF6033 family protein [Lachnospiraceae bacterium]